jgi:hypothetical protein
VCEQDFSLSTGEEETSEQSVASSMRLPKIFDVRLPAAVHPPDGAALFVFGRIDESGRGSCLSDV